MVINMLRYLYVFLIGGFLYGILETIYRGYTHWTMLLTGGFCLCAIFFVETHLQAPILVKALIGCAIITTAELSVGLLVNRVLHMGVWDYSGMSMNFMGQICLQFSSIWFLISFPAIFLCRWMNSTLLERILP